jgi:hypothetical protein
MSWNFLFGRIGKFRMVFKFINMVQILFVGVEVSINFNVELWNKMRMEIRVRD